MVETSDEEIAEIKVNNLNGDVLDQSLPAKGFRG